MQINTRNDLINKLFPMLPRFRIDQIQTALFNPNNKNWNDLSTLSKEMRGKIIESIPWTSLKSVKIVESDNRETCKALLQTQDSHAIETVLMKNKREQWTICISSQIGCAMGCAFCATGKLGLIRNLTVDEIVDQVRFWQEQIKPRDLCKSPFQDESEGFSSAARKDSGNDMAISLRKPDDATGENNRFQAGSDFCRGPSNERISNIVVMGMGEPLLNYENVRDALNLIIKYTDIGKTRITVSTAGVLPRMRQILTDPLWPHVRFAVSLHSVDAQTRKKIMPSSFPTFLDDLAIWAKDYLKIYGNRRHYLTFEYLLLSGVNDSETDAKKLASYVKKIGNIKVNILIYNDTGLFHAPSSERILEFSKVLQNCGVDSTRRRSMGSEISAACGQLAKITS